MRKKFILVLGVLVVVALMSGAAQADLDLTGGKIYVDASENNTTFADGTSPWSTATGGAQAGLWWQRTTHGYNADGTYGAGRDIFEALTDENHWRSTGDVQGLKTTVTGLVDGQEYDVYVIYGSKSEGENWNVTADFSVIATDPTTGVVQSGITYGAAAATLQGVSVLAGENIDDMGGGIFSFRGLVGTVTGTASGTLDVYIDDLSNTTGDNDRAWYDGIYLVPEPATIALLGLGGLLLRRKRG